MVGFGWARRLGEGGFRPCLPKTHERHRGEGFAGTVLFLGPRGAGVTVGLGDGEADRDGTKGPEHRLTVLSARAFMDGGNVALVGVVFAGSSP